MLSSYRLGPWPGNRTNGSLVRRRRQRLSALLCVVVSISANSSVDALDGGTLRVNPRNGWQAFEVISVGDDPASDGFAWAMPGAFDGIGAWLPNSTTLRLQVNHESSDATISEVDLRVADFKAAIHNMIDGGTTGGTGFVAVARQAYDRFSSDGGLSWISTTDTSNTSFSRFCSGQSYAAHTFGAERGFVDEIYVTGEEVSAGRLIAVDLNNRDLYQLSGVSGSANGGIGGMPRDSWENAALLDTGETEHVALLLSPDGGSQRMQIYIGEKGRDASGSMSTDFLARNGLAYGSYYYLQDALPMNGLSTDGTFGTAADGALRSFKLEDVDTSPAQPTRAVLGDQDSGLFTFDFQLDFSGGSFSTVDSHFAITKIQNHVTNTLEQFGDADNVDWTAATTLAGTTYAEGLIFVNEDNSNGEIWISEPNGSGLMKIGDTVGLAGSFESTGILDISSLVGFVPGSIVLTNNQGDRASLTVLIHPAATVIPEPASWFLLLLAVLLWGSRRAFVLQQPLD